MHRRSPPAAYALKQFCLFARRKTLLRLSRIEVSDKAMSFSHDASRAEGQEERRFGFIAKVSRGSSLNAAQTAELQPPEMAWKRNGACSLPPGRLRTPSGQWPKHALGLLPANSRRKGLALVTRGKRSLKGRKALFERRALSPVLGNLRIQLFDLLGLFLGFVQQHRNQLVIAHRNHLPVRP